MYHVFIDNLVVQEDDMSWLEWSELLLETVFENNTLGMFHVLSDRTGFIHPNPSRNHRHYPIHYYELAGKVVGKYLVARAKDTRSLNYRLKVRLSRSFLVQLIGASPTICVRYDKMCENILNHFRQTQNYGIVINR